MRQELGKCRDLNDFKRPERLLPDLNKILLVLANGLENLIYKLIIIISELMARLNLRDMVTVLEELK